MAKFIDLTQLDGDSITINVDYIDIYYPDPENKDNTIIQLKSKGAKPKFAFVLESYDKIKRLINTANPV